MSVVGPYSSYKTLGHLDALNERFGYALGSYAAIITECTTHQAHPPCFSPHLTPDTKDVGMIFAEVSAILLLYVPSNSEPWEYGLSNYGNYQQLRR